MEEFRSVACEWFDVNTRSASSGTQDADDTVTSCFYLGNLSKDDNEKNMNQYSIITSYGCLCLSTEV